MTYSYLVLLNLVRSVHNSLAQTLAQTGIMGLIDQFRYLAPLAQTWIIGLVAYYKPEHHGRQGGPG